MILKILLSALIFFVSTVGWAGFPNFVPVEKSESGVGKWQEFHFGQARILSCTTGVQNLSMVVGGLQVKLNPDWIMKKPLLKPLFENAPAWIETPLRPGSGKNTQYQGDVFFPLVYTRDSTDMSPFKLGVQGDFPVCQGKVCMTLPIQMSLPLTADEANYTSVCGYILKQQLQAPLMASAQGVSGFAWPENDEVIMLFSGIKKPLIAFLQTLGTDDFQVVETQLKKTGVLMKVKTNFWEIGQKKEWVLITDKGAFRVPVEWQNSPMKLPNTNLPISVWWVGWNLIFLTPIFIWWGLGIKKTNKQWQKEICKFCLFLPLFFILRLLLNRYIAFDWSFYAIFLFGLVCLFPPQNKWSALFLFLVWPYFPKLPEMSIGVWVLWILVMCFEMSIPFVFLYYKASEVGKILRDLKKKNFFIYNFIFLFPTVILLTGHIWDVCQDKNFYQNEINKNGFTVVVKESAGKKFKKIPEVSFVEPDSVLGKTLQKIYEQKTPLVLFQDSWGRVILPEGSSLSDISEFMLNWKNYHAGYRP